MPQSAEILAELKSLRRDLERQEEIHSAQHTETRDWLKAVSAGVDRNSGLIAENAKEIQNLNIDKAKREGGDTVRKGLLGVGVTLGTGGIIAWLSDFLSRGGK